MRGREAEAYIQVSAKERRICWCGREREEKRRRDSRLGCLYSPYKPALYKNSEVIRRGYTDQDWAFVYKCSMGSGREAETLIQSSVKKSSLLTKTGERRTKFKSG
jgi:hypothetical protein